MGFFTVYEFDCLDVFDGFWSTPLFIMGLLKKFCLLLFAALVCLNLGIIHD